MPFRSGRLQPDHPTHWAGNAAIAVAIVGYLACSGQSWPETQSSPRANPIAQTTPAELRDLRFARGSMGPKVEAACRFVEAGGAMAGIGTLSEAADMLDGNAGTVVTRARTAGHAGDH